MEPVKTLAFIDLETTGLPDQEFYKTKITEISIVACVKQHLLDLKEDETLPRVLQKLTLCLNPFKRINFKTTDLTGLDNWLLENERTFDQTTVDLLANFFGGLQQPTCLLAHNGFKFDYPVLRKLISDNSDEVPSVLDSLRCADSLDLFRQIDKERSDRQNEELEERRSDDERVMAFVNKELERMAAEAENAENVKLSEQVCVKTEALSSSDEWISQFDAIEEIIDWQLNNESTPRSKPEASNGRKVGGQRIKVEEPVTPTTSKENPTTSALAPAARKRLFDTPKSSSFTKGFRLTDIYQRIYEKPPDVLHRAEDDCMLLLKCVASPKYRQAIIDTVDEQGICFKDIEPIGYKIK